MPLQHATKYELQEGERPVCELCHPPNTTNSQRHLPAMTRHGLLPIRRPKASNARSRLLFIVRFTLSTKFGRLAGFLPATVSVSDMLAGCLYSSTLSQYRSLHSSSHVIVLNLTFSALRYIISHVIGTGGRHALAVIPTSSYTSRHCSAHKNAWPIMPDIQRLQHFPEEPSRWQTQMLCIHIFHEPWHHHHHTATHSKQATAPCTHGVGEHVVWSRLHHIHACTMLWKSADVETFKISQILLHATQPSAQSRSA